MSEKIVIKGEEFDALLTCHGLLFPDQINPYLARAKVWHWSNTIALKKQGNKLHIYELFDYPGPMEIGWVFGDWDAIKLYKRAPDWRRGVVRLYACDRTVAVDSDLWKLRRALHIGKRLPYVGEATYRGMLEEDDVYIVVYFLPPEQVNVGRIAWIDGDKLKIVEKRFRTSEAPLVTEAGPYLVRLGTKKRELVVLEQDELIYE